MSGMRALISKFPLVICAMTVYSEMARQSSDAASSSNFDRHRSAKSFVACRLQVIKEFHRRKTAS